MPKISALPGPLIGANLAAGDEFPVTDVSAVVTDRIVASELANALMGLGGLGWFNVKTYGAIGNGSIDDSTAVQAAITAAGAAGGGTVYFPPGIYKIVTGLTIPSDNINLRG